MTAQNPATRVGAVLGVDAGSASLAPADHLAHRLAAGLPAEAVVSTHLVRDEDAATTALSFALPTPAAAEALWAALVTDPELASAGLVWGDRVVGPRGPAARAGAAVAEFLGGDGGRAVLFPGWRTLTGEVPVARMLAETAVAGLLAIGAPDGEPLPDVVQTRDHVRPQWRAGRLLLAVTPTADGKLAPFEVPNPTPCCADH